MTMITSFTGYVYIVHINLGAMDLKEENWAVW